MQSETSRSIAIHPDGERFALGAEWSLQVIDANGTSLWTQSTPGTAWSVNISADGRLVVAAYGDGTIRWHRMDNGVELLAFMPLVDRSNWIAWTPEGFYDATPGARSLLGWHVNRGWDAPPDTVAVEDIPGSFRPALLPLILQEMETLRALGLAIVAEHNRQIRHRTNSQLSPGAVLHVLAIGISLYNEEFANQLRLRYADQDAHAFTSAVLTTQTYLYAQVRPQLLQNGEGTKTGILRALATVRAGVAAGNGNDLAIIFFSGHGAMVDGTFHLLPHDVDVRDLVGIRASGLSSDQLRSELLMIAARGRVRATLAR